MATPRSLADERLIFNEQAKLIATALNALATFTFGAAILAPLVAAFWGRGVIAVDLDAGHVIVGEIIWLVIAVALHLAGQLVLFNLRQP